MQCLNCGGAFEWAGNGQHARCTRCLSLFSNQNGQLTPIVVEAPGGGFNPEFNNVFAQNLGFGPPPPGAQPMPPPHMRQQQQHNMSEGTFNVGGEQWQVKINGQKPGEYVANEAKSAVLWWGIGAVVVLFVLCGGAGLGGYIWYEASKPSPGADPTGKAAAAAAAWDGKSTLECKGNDVMNVAGVTATAGVKASGNCKLNLVNVNITAPVGIEASASAKVNMTGGSINASTNTVVASAAAEVNLVGTTVTGKSKKSGAAKINGAP